MEKRSEILGALWHHLETRTLYKGTVIKCQRFTVQKVFGRSFELILVGKKKKCVEEWKDGKNEKKEGRNSKRGERKKVLEQGKRVVFCCCSFHTQIHPSPLCQNYISKSHTDPPLTKPPYHSPESLG